jgi:hypothetical protein
MFSFVFALLLLISGLILFSRAERTSIDTV